MVGLAANWGKLARGSEVPRSELKVERESISKKLRFEVFKRDGFTCQYCGGKAPDVLLHVDHVKPVVNGGQCDILNLVTSCAACNLGKGPRELSDSSVLAKQQAQLDELNERRAQLELMLQWREELKNITGLKAVEIVKAFQAAAPGWRPVRGEVESWLRRFPFDVILDAIEISRDKLYLDSDGKVDKDSVNAFYHYIPRVAACRKMERQEPGVEGLLRLRGYLRTFMRFREWECLALLRRAREAGLTVEDMKRISSSHRSWGDFAEQIDAAIAVATRPMASE